MEPLGLTTYVTPRDTRSTAETRPLEKTSGEDIQSNFISLEDTEHILHPVSFGKSRTTMSRDTTLRICELTVETNSFTILAFALSLANGPVTDCINASLGSV